VFQSSFLISGEKNTHNKLCHYNNLARRKPHQCTIFAIAENTPLLTNGIHHIIFAKKGVNKNGKQY